jgi:hypothetical protein
MCLGIVYECDLLSMYTLRDQLVAQNAVDAKRTKPLDISHRVGIGVAVGFRREEVAEDEHDATTMRRLGV